MQVSKVFKSFITVAKICWHFSYKLSCLLWENFENFRKNYANDLIRELAVGVNPFTLESAKFFFFFVNGRVNCFQSLGWAELLISRLRRPQQNWSMILKCVFPELEVRKHILFNSTGTDQPLGLQLIFFLNLNLPVGGAGIDPQFCKM